MKGTLPKTTFQSVKYNPTNEKAAPHRAAGRALKKKYRGYKTVLVVQMYANLIYILTRPCP